MRAIIPITFRLPVDLKSAVDRAAAARRLSLNSFVEVALRNETASACDTCGQPARHIPRGCTPEFSAFTASQRSGSVYVRLERRAAPVVYKGRLPRIHGRHLHLDAESPTHSPGENVILLDEVVDWEPAVQGTSTEDWDRTHPGIAVDRWGLE